MNETRETQRGFLITEFVDCYGIECKLQESSGSDEDGLHLWLGLSKAHHHHVDGTCMPVMNLNREKARWLAERLNMFAETGRFPRD